MPSKVLQCLTAGSSITNAYVYNNAIAGLTLQQVGDASATFLTADGSRFAASAGTLNYRDYSITGTLAQIAYVPTDIAYRHGNSALASYVDGHVELNSTVPVGNFLAVVNGLTGEFCAGNPNGFLVDMVNNVTTLTVSDGTPGDTDLPNFSGTQHARHFPGTGGYVAQVIPDGADTIFSVFMVYRSTGNSPSGGGSALLWANLWGGMEWNDFGLQWATSGNVNYSQGSGIYSPSAAAPVNTIHLVGYSGTGGTSTNTGTFVTDHSTTAVTNVAGHTGASTCRMYIASENNTNQHGYFLGDIADVIIYNRILTAAEISSVQNYLCSKYGI